MTVRSRLASGLAPATLTTRLVRLAVCDQCPHLSAIRRCAKCGCFVDVKARLATQRCPEGKW